MSDAQLLAIGIILFFAGLGVLSEYMIKAHDRRMELAEKWDRALNPPRD